MKKWLFLSLLLICFQNYIKSDDCLNSVYNSVTSFNLANPDFSNPALTSGTNLNDLGKYDACIKNVNQTYILINFPLPIVKDNRTIPLPVFLGLCAPKECENEKTFDSIGNFIVEKFNSTSLTRKDVKVVASVTENNKYKHFTVSHYFVLVILIVYLIFALGFVNCFFSSGLFGRKSENYENLEANDENGKTQFPTNSAEDEKRMKEREALLLSRANNNTSAINADQSSTYEDTKSVRTDVSIPNSIPRPTEKPDRKVRYVNALHKVSAILFDFNKNLNTIFEKRRTEESDLKIFDGIRAIAAAFVVLSHSFLAFTDMPQKNPETVSEDYIRTFRWQILFNGSFAVDVFFSMSGFLLTYITLRRRETMTKASCGQIMMGVLFRLLRIWPLYFLLFLAYWKFYIYLLDGPTSGFIFNNEIESCNIQWPFMAILINNFTLGRFEGAKYPWCFSWGWYIPNDFQLSIVGIIFMLIYLKNRRNFYIVFAVVCSMCLGGEIYQFWKYKFGVNIFDLSEGGAEYMFVYYLIYIRCGPYFIGYLLGIFYAEYKEDVKHGRESTNRSFFEYLKTNKVLYITFYILGLLIMATLVFVVYFSYHSTWSTFQKVLYNVLSRKGFVVGFFLTCLPIMQGNLQSLGSWMASDFFVPLSKVSFAVYVIHPFVIRYLYYNFRHAVYFEMSMLLVYTTSFIVVVNILSIFVTAIFDAPFMHLRLLLLEKRANVEKKSIVSDLSQNKPERINS